MSYLTNDFLLRNETAKKLYFNYAKKMPIFDYHCHLSEYQILENKEFIDIFEVWLGGDHYKWRLMRNAGVNEEFITGSKSNYDKFLAYCKALSTAFGNPLYHWSQVELQEFFNCNLEINETNAPKIWEECNEYIHNNHLTPSKLISKSNVKILFTTNEIFDDLEVFNKIKNKGYSFSVRPAFRADKIMNIEAEKYNEFINRLGDIKTLDELEYKIEERLKAFISVGCVASDIALQKVEVVSSKEEASKVFALRRLNKPLNDEQIASFKGYFTYFLMKLYSKYNISTELHLGAMRNNNTVMLNKLGLDTGYDSIAEDNSTLLLSRLMDKLNSENSLPSLILFNLNPKMNTELMTLLGCFQDDSKIGKIQYGPAWWFLDNKVGMEKHLQDLTATGHLGSFVGMLTDSRSFLSYPRHHYFRRILCNYLGEMMERNEMTNDIEFVGKVIENICFNNAIRYFSIKL